MLILCLILLALAAVGTVALWRASRKRVTQSSTEESPFFIWYTVMFLEGAAVLVLLFCTLQNRTSCASLVLQTSRNNFADFLDTVKTTVDGDFKWKCGDPDIEGAQASISNHVLTIEGPLADFSGEIKAVKTTFPDTGPLCAKSSTIVSAIRRAVVQPLKRPPSDTNGLCILKNSTISNLQYFSDQLKRPINQKGK